MITQLIDFINTQEFLVGVAIGMLIIILVYIGSEILKKKTFESESFYNDIFSINEHIQNSQQENIEAKKTLDELYRMFKEVEGNLR